MTLSVVTGVEAAGNPPAGVALASSLGIGQVVLAFVQGGTIPASSVVTDNVNSGNYSLLCDVPAQNLAVYWKITNASGTPTVSLASPGGFAFLWAMGVKGFVGTPTQDTGITANTSGTSLAPTLNATSNFANEIMLMSCGITYTDNITVSGWTPGTSSGATKLLNAFYAIEATAGTTNNFVGSIAGSQTWYLQLCGIYDNVPTGLTVPQFGETGSTANPVSCTLSGAQSPGAIIVMLHSNGNMGTPSITDSVNGNSYIQIGSTYFPAAGGSCSAFYIRTNSTGTPIIQASNTNSAAMAIMALNVTGFVGTPTVDAAAYLGAFNASSATVSATPASNFNNEILCCTVNDQSFVSVQPSGWVSPGVGWYVLNTTAGSSPFSLTLGASSSWAYLAVGVYDNTAVTPSPIRKVRRQIFTTYYPA